MGRQIGVALGVAVLVAVLSGSGMTLGGFHTGWLIGVGGALAAGLGFAALGRPRARTAVVGGVAAEGST